MDARTVELRPCNLEAVWPRVQQRAYRWLSEVDGGEAALLQEFREGRTLAWCSGEAVVVMSVVPAPGGGLHLFIRAGVSFEPSRGAFERHMPAIVKIATDMGAKDIRFRSPRRGWERALGPGWNVAHVEWSYRP